MPTLMVQIAQATGANFTVQVFSSQDLGTQADQLSGSPKFNLDVENPFLQVAEYASASAISFCPL